MTGTRCETKTLTQGFDPVGWVATNLLPLMECETTETPMALEKELETLRRELPNLLANGGEGKFVVVFEDRIVGIYTSYEDALAIGYEKCGLKPFLVKKIQAVEQVQYFSRDLAFPCPT